MFLYIVNSRVMSLASGSHIILTVSGYYDTGLEESFEGKSNTGNPAFLPKVAVAALAASARHEYSYIYTGFNDWRNYDYICAFIYHHCFSSLIF